MFAASSSKSQQGLKGFEQFGKGFLGGRFHIFERSLAANLQVVSQHHPFSPGNQSLLFPFLANPQESLGRVSEEFGDFEPVIEPFALGQFEEHLGNFGGGDGFSFGTGDDFASAFEVVAEGV